MRTQPPAFRAGCRGGRSPQNSWDIWHDVQSRRSLCFPAKSSCKIVLILVKPGAPAAARVVFGAPPAPWLPAPPRIPGALRRHRPPAPFFMGPTWGFSAILLRGTGDISLHRLKKERSPHKCSARPLSRDGHKMRPASPRRRPGLEKARQCCLHERTLIGMPRLRTEVPPLPRWAPVAGDRVFTIAFPSRGAVKTRAGRFGHESQKSHGRGALTSNHWGLYDGAAYPRLDT